MIVGKVYAVVVTRVEYFKVQARSRREAEDRVLNRGTDEDAAWHQGEETIGVHAEEAP